MYALTGATGKIGGAVLHAILEHNLISPNELVICTTGNPQDARWNDLRGKGAAIRQANFDEPTSLIKAYTGCQKLFLVSSPVISLDYFDAPPGSGRERHHRAAIDAAIAAGVKHIYYTSLAFGSESVAGVMRAHLRTEAYLHSLKNIKYTIIREGLYNESWPLYLGNYDIKNDTRKEIVVAGDGPLSWTAISDLGLASALVLVDPTDQYEGKTFYLSSNSNNTLAELVGFLAAFKKIDVELKVVSREEYCRYYIEDRGRDEGDTKWWVSSYEAVKNGECAIDDSTFDNLLKGKVVPKSIMDTMAEMLNN